MKVVEIEVPHDPETGEVLNEDVQFTEDIEESEYVDDTLREAKKFLGLMEAFDISPSGAKAMEANLIKNKEEIIKSLEIVDDIPEELNTSLIESEELLSDFLLVRQSLRDDIKATRVLLQKLSDDMSSSHADDLSGSMIAAYAELKKSNIESMKLLMGSYSSVADTQLKVKKLITEIKAIDDKEDKENGTVNIQNNFIGTTGDILAKLKGGH